MRHVYLPRAGYGFLAGFPVWLAGRFAERALERGLAVVTAALGDERVHIIVWPGTSPLHHVARQRRFRLG